MEILDKGLFLKMIEPGPRLGWIKEWLLNEVWSSERYGSGNPIDFLRMGEDMVNRFEMLISSAADRIYGELLSGPGSSKALINALSDPKTAVVVFDGLSLREIPMVLRLAEKSGFQVTLVDTSLSAIPSETMDFIERELPCGRIAPSQIVNRKELKEKGIVSIYTSDITQTISGDCETSSLLIWTSFPDSTYNDSGAKFENHFENIHALFETACMNIVQPIKGKQKVIITSDHGYIFFGTGMDFPRTASELKDLNTFFGNDRNVSLEADSKIPKSSDIYEVPSRKVAMVKGRVRTRSTGEAASRLYRHGGLSLMEMITPWIELEVNP